MDELLVIDVIFGFILIIYYIYLKRNTPNEKLLFESRTFSIYGVSSLLISWLIEFILLLRFDKDNIYKFVLYFLTLLLHLFREPKKFYIYDNGFYFYTVVGEFIHIGNFTEMIRCNITAKGYLKLRFEDPNGDIRRSSIPVKFNEFELITIRRIFLDKGIWIN